MIDATGETVRACERWPDPGGDYLLGDTLLDENGEPYRWETIVTSYDLLRRRIDHTTAAGWAKSAILVAIGRRLALPEPAPPAEDHDVGDRLTDEQPGTVATRPAAPHGPPAPRVGVAA